MANYTNIRYSREVTNPQRTATFWFILLSAGLTVLSILSSQKISQTNIESLASAVDQAIQVWQEPTASPGVVVATEAGKVKRVIDGDTFELESGQKVRLIGVNTPELHHPQKGVECFGQEAYQYSKTWLEGKTVVMQKDVSETDRYGRLLRYVWLENSLFNQTLVADGYAYATAYPPDVWYQDILSEAEAAAQASSSGLWKSCPTQD